MTIEEAREKAANGDFSGADEFNKSDAPTDVSWLTEGAQEEIAYAESEEEENEQTVD